MVEQKDIMVDPMWLMLFVPRQMGATPSVPGCTSDKDSPISVDMEIFDISGTGRAICIVFTKLSRLDLMALCYGHPR